MSNVAIRIEGLGKQYRLGGLREQYSTLRDQFRKWTSLRGLLRQADHAERRPSFWALKDVSFEVKQGEVIGIIGRNGAGKSTLLKILSRITEPTEGGADIHGRVGSLLEVGTGFHPELTGRENVYLNGAIMGMKRAEIAQKFDEIVAFAEVEKFVETPVKHYSSGMYMRLAFAVAAHLEPEILIVDEVLAVGDTRFQKKCLGKMGQVAHNGRTVLYVSHDTATIRTLCDRAVLLEGGSIRMHGPADRVVAEYLGEGEADTTFVRAAEETLPVQIESADVAVRHGSQGPEMEVLTIVRSDQTAMVSIDILMLDGVGTPIGFAPVGSFNQSQEVRLEVGVNRILSRHSLRDLANGTYLLTIGVANTMVCYHDRVEQCLRFEFQWPPPSNCFRRLQQSRGYGHFVLPYLGHETID